MSIVSITRSVCNHPFNRDRRIRAIARFASWQFRSRLTRSKLTIPLVDNVHLRISRGMRGATGNIYAGLWEHQEMSFTLHYLRAADLFADVGANVGVFTLLAGGAVGAEVIAFEPSPETLVHLRENVEFNALAGRCTIYPFAVGESDGVIRFAQTSDSAQNHVATTQELQDAVEVRQVSLDGILDGRVPRLIKIDVEGFETNVVNGARRTLCSPDLKGVFIELVGEGRRYGFDESLVHHTLLDCGLTPYRYDAIQRELHLMERDRLGSVLYLRDADEATQRVKSAPRFRLINRSI